MTFGLDVRYRNHDNTKTDYMRTMCGTILAVMALAAHGVALLEANGLVTEKSAGWRFEASE